MAKLTIPKRGDVVTSLQSYSRTYIPDLSPDTTTRRGFIGPMLKSLGSALHDWYVALRRAAREFFPQTATEDFLLEGWWKDITELSRNPAAAAKGKLVLTGTSGTTLAQGAAVSAGSTGYTADLSAVITSQFVTAASLKRDGTTAIFETAAPHNLATGLSLTIAGADQSDYNITATITVTAANEFTFDVANSPTTPATTAGAITASGIWGNVDVTADNTGAGGNLSAASTAIISSPPVGMDSTALVTFDGLADGSDLEGIESYRDRILEALGIDYGTFSAAEIKVVAKQVSGVTRVWVNSATLGATNGVNEGQVQIYFVRDNDADIFPSTAETETVKDHIISKIMPAHTAAEDVTVAAPTPKAVDIVFSALLPDGASVRTAITNELKQFFAETVEFGVNVSIDDIRCVIKQAYDTETQQGITSFTLSDPTTDVTVSTTELPQLGAITWPS